MQPSQFVSRMVYFVLALVESFLGLRFILRLFNANASADFVRWIYENTQPLLAPFVNIFTSARLEGGYTVEFSTLFALLVYGLIGFLILYLVDSLAPPLPAKKVVKR